MQGATLDELRDLSRRSRRAQRYGFLALAALLLLLPIALMLPAWGVYAAFCLGGIAFVAYAYAVGQERGAFRSVFRRIADDRRVTRTLVPETPESGKLQAPQQG